MSGAKPRCFRMTSPSQIGMKIAIAKSVAVARRSPLKRNARTTRPEKMSRMPLVHINGKAAGSWIGMPKAVEAPIGLSMKLMPSPMIATGITSVHQNSGEFILNIELSKSVFMFIFFLFFSRQVNGELVEGMRIVDSTSTMPETSKSLMSLANSVLCIYRRLTSPGSSPAA
jgi:hypothetical protein